MKKPKAKPADKNQKLKDQAAAAVGKHATYDADGWTLAVEILDWRWGYGRVDFYVKVAGQSCKRWVRASHVKVH